MSCFILTLSSPLTIVFWAGIFSAKAVEHQYTRRQLIPFGIGGAATFLFLSVTMFIMLLIKTTIPPVVIRILNIGVGAVLVYYALSRLSKTVQRGEG